MKLPERACTNHIREAWRDKREALPLRGIGCSLGVTRDGGLGISAPRIAVSYAYTLCRLLRMLRCCFQLPPKKSWTIQDGVCP